MTSRASLLWILLLALSARAQPVPGAFQGMTLSLGQGRAVCARITFDRKVAEAGGRVFVLDAASAGDEPAIRMAEAVVTRRGGLSSRAGSAARRHGVPAAVQAVGELVAQRVDVVHLCVPPDLHARLARECLE
ncbi:MAG: PEP-utilizing enzyme, partial [Elusimicrobiota bacterium]